jgi:DNA/RNA-binding domain of Phe-tRNA-synthetase-like protein
MKFVVTQEIFELFPGLKLPVIVAEGVEAAADSAGVERLWRQAWENARLSGPEYGNAQPHPHVAAWRDAMAPWPPRASPAGSFPQLSVESLLRRELRLTREGETFQGNLPTPGRHFG